MSPPVRSHGASPDRSGLNLPLISNNFGCDSGNRHPFRDIEPSTHEQRFLANDARSSPGVTSGVAAGGVTNVPADSLPPLTAGGKDLISAHEQSILATVEARSSTGVQPTTLDTHFSPGNNASHAAATKTCCPGGSDAKGDFLPDNQCGSYAGAVAPRLLRRPDVFAHKFTALQAQESGHGFTLSLPSEFCKKRFEEFRYAIIGKLLLEKGDTPRPTAELKQELQSIWKISSEWKLIPMCKGFYILKFDTMEDKNIVKDRKLWKLSKGSLRMREWVKGFNPYKEVSSLSQVWVRIYNLPVEFWHPEVITAIGNVVGTSIKIDGASAYADVGHYVRLLVEVDLSLPLQESMQVQGDDMAYQVEFYYEKLPLYCTHCRITGHCVDKCNKKQPRVEITDQVKVNSEKEKVITKGDNQTDPGSGNKSAEVLKRPVLEGPQWQVVPASGHSQQEKQQLSLRTQDKNRFALLSEEAADGSQSQQETEQQQAAPFTEQQQFTPRGPVLVVGSPVLRATSPSKANCFNVLAIDDSSHEIDATTMNAPDFLGISNHASQVVLEKPSGAGSPTHVVPNSSSGIPTAAITTSTSQDEPCIVRTPESGASIVPLHDDSTHATVPLDQVRQAPTAKRGRGRPKGATKQVGKGGISDTSIKQRLRHPASISTPGDTAGLAMTAVSSQRWGDIMDSDIQTVYPQRWGDIMDSDIQTVYPQRWGDIMDSYIHTEDDALEF